MYPNQNFENRDRISADHVVCTRLSPEDVTCEPLERQTRLVHTIPTTAI